MNEYCNALFDLQAISFSFFNELKQAYQLLCKKLNSLYEVPPKHWMLIAIKMNKNGEKASELVDIATEILNDCYLNNSSGNEYELMIIKKNIKNIKDCMAKMKYNAYVHNGDFQAEVNRILRETIADVTKLTTQEIKSSPTSPWIMDDTYSSTTTQVAKPRKTKFKQVVKQNCTQEDKNVVAVYNSAFIPILDLNNNRVEKESLVVGNNYYVENPFDNTIINKVYELKHIVVKNDVKYLIAKKAKGFNFAIYPLSPTLCEYLKIPFEEDLTVLSDSSNWKRYYSPITENLTFNPNDMSTYPTQEGLVNFVIVKLSGFQSLRKHHLVTPNNHEIDPQTFLKSLCVTFKYDLDGEKNNVITTTRKIGWDLLTFENDDITREGCICDKEGNLFLKLDLRCFGITPSMTCGLNASDIFKFSWVEENVVETEVEEAQISPEDKPLKQDLFSKLFDYSYEHPPMNVDDVIKPINGMVRINPTSRGFLYEIYQNGRWHSMTREEFEHQKNSGKIVPIDPTNIR